MSFYERRLLLERLLSAAMRISRLSICSRQHISFASSEGISLRERVVGLAISLGQEVLKVRRGETRCLPSELELLLDILIREISDVETSQALTRVLEYEITKAMNEAQGLITEFKYALKSITKRASLDLIIYLEGLVLKMLKTPCLIEEPQDLKVRALSIEKRMKLSW